MELSFKEEKNNAIKRRTYVLILILMELSFKVLIFDIRQIHHQFVLILILMELSFKDVGTSLENASATGF